MYMLDWDQEQEGTNPNRKLNVIKSMEVTNFDTSGKTIV